MPLQSGHELEQHPLSTVFKANRGLLGSYQLAIMKKKISSYMKASSPRGFSFKVEAHWISQFSNGFFLAKEGSWRRSVELRVRCRFRVFMLNFALSWTTPRNWLKISYTATSRINSDG
jgi:hypothetical protein